MNSSWDSQTEVGEDLEEYKKSLRDRACRSMTQLRSVLEEQPSAEAALSPKKGAGMAHSSPQVAEGWGEGDLEMTWQELQHSHAVNQLRSLLRQQERESAPSTPTSRRKTSRKRPSEKGDADLPAVQDLVPIINSQSEYIQHLEEEVKFCKEELFGMKQRISVVILENDKLHEELKLKTVEDTLKDYTILDTSTNALESCPQTVPRAPDPRQHSHRQQQQVQPPSAPAQPLASNNPTDALKWQMELEKLKLLYQAKTETLEAQVMSLRKDLAVSQKDCEEMKGRLRHQESVAAMSSGNRVGGLCLKCAQHEAVLAQTHTDVHMQAIERLTRERDELMAVLSSQRNNRGEMEQREANAYRQVKQAVEMAEEANLEKTQALIQCEQLKKEMLRQKDRLEMELAAEQEKITKAKEKAREEMKKEKEELAASVMSLSVKVASLEGQLERLTREKNSVANQLEEAQRQLSSQELDISKVCGELRYQLNQSQLKRDEAEKELREFRTKTVRELELREQEIEKLRLELNETKQRLERAQQDSACAKDESLRLTELLGRSEHQLHLTRLEKEAAVRCRSDDVKALTFQAQHREQELIQKMQQMEALHEKSVNELEALLNSQNTLIGKLKDECRILGTKLERVTEKNRSEIGQLSQENMYLRDTLEKLQSRSDEMEAQCIQHGRMHERMKQRLGQLDQHCQLSAQHVMELLNKQNQLLKERHALTEEMQHLRVQLPSLSRIES
ncbi:serologically defined colon cancer antigen 8 homolog isoform X1 [Acipenser ruthenus]|uniref:serologically defined colon cancer antigen 8 homolog isoform X1 n=1 Tax=Acipenser ruthenus TaxID=7906 RepID=UPI001560661F|nr:serologically defined colon cancer antigen 8 homolog isoform X1 [Acipenser ruthenus]